MSPIIQQLSSRGVVGGHGAYVTVAATATYPNEPAGAIQKIGGDVGWPVDWSNVVAKNPPETTSQPWEGIYWQGGPGACDGWGCDTVNPSKAITVTNQNGPVNSTIVGRYNYTAANCPTPFGDSIIKPASFDIFKVPSNCAVQYVSVHLKFSSNFFLAAEVVKVFNCWGGGGAQATIYEVHAGGAAREAYSAYQDYTEEPYWLGIRRQNGENSPASGFDSKVHQTGGYQTSYYDDTPAMYNDVWYQLEFLHNWNTGYSECFVDSGKVCDGTMDANAMGFDNSEFSIDGTFGGQSNGAPDLSEAMYMYLDDLYMSYTTT